MLMSESIEIGEMVRRAMVDRHGEEALGSHYRAFETICSATQDRQDAVQALLDTHPFDFTIVIGGYNSSNTRNLARICAKHVTTYHIAEPSCLVSGDELHHLPSSGAPVTQPTEVTASGWLPPHGPLSVGVTAGASTPDNVVGQVIGRLAGLAG